MRSTIRAIAGKIQRHIDLWLTAFKNRDFVLLVHDLRMKFGFFFLKLEIYFLQFQNVIFKLWLTQPKFRRKILLSFHDRFPLGLRIGPLKIKVIVPHGS